MKSLLSIITGLAVFCGLALSSSAQVNTAVEMDEQLLDKFASTQQVEANAAAIEIFKRGEKMMPLLLRQKGNTSLFYGNFNLDPPAMFIWLPTGDKIRDKKLSKDGLLTTMEVASLFMINAIFYKDMDFAQTSYLVDLSLPSEQQKAANKSYLVKKAWNAVEIWSQKLEKEGIKKLRESRTPPFNDSDIRFY